MESSGYHSISFLRSRSFLGHRMNVLIAILLFFTGMVFSQLMGVLEAHSIVSWAGSALGSLFSVSLALWLSRKSSHELRREATQLRQSTDRVLRFLEMEGNGVSIVRDKNGAVIGLAFQETITDTMEASASVIDGSLERPPS